MKTGDLVMLSLHGRMMTGVPNITDKIGIILCDDLLHDNLYLVKWLATGVSGEVHKDFIQKLEKK
jgi:ABC-type uncharacterized transport system YnjBCD ATPase subunit